MALVLWMLKFYQTVIALSVGIPVIILIFVKICIRHNRRHRKAQGIVQVEITDPVMIARVEYLESSMDIINEQIQQQNDLLRILEQKYNMTYDDEQCNKIMGNILKVRANIIKSIDKSDKIGFEINKIGKEIYYSKR